MTSSNYNNKSKSALIGFDGFIDKIFRIKRNNDTFFEKASQFGDYILEKKGNNFSLEIEEITTKIGGNAVILANALGKLGIKNDLIASLGFPKINPLFEEIYSNTGFYSYAEPGIAYAHEFSDSKIMLAENGALNSINWENLKTLIGFEKLINLFEINDLYCLVNWSEILGITSIWEGILFEILPKIYGNKERIAFFDLADCSNKEPTDLRNILKVISAFSKYTKVILSLNKNETETVFKVLFPLENLNFEEKGKKIFDSLQIDKLIIHHSKESFCVSKNEIVCSKTYWLENPFISTGAGDHFNAGFCTAILNNFSIENSLQFANATAHLYISNGQSPNFNRVSYFIENQTDANNNF